MRLSHALGVPFLWVEMSLYIFMQSESGWQWSVGINSEIMHLIKIKCSVSQELSVSHYLLHTTNLLAPHPHTAIYTHACPKATCSLCACMNACTRDSRVSEESKLRQKIKPLTFLATTRCIAGIIRMSIFPILLFNSGYEKRNVTNLESMLTTDIILKKNKPFRFVWQPKVCLNLWHCCAEPPPACKLSDISSVGAWLQTTV